MVFKAYCDGSFSPGVVKWAYIIYDENNNPVTQDKGILTDPEFVEGRQIAGELEAVKKAILWAVNEDCFLEVYYDYTGIYNWIKDFYEEYAIPWKQNKNYVASYRRFINDYHNYVKKFIKVKAHSTNEFNNSVDKLAKTAN